MDFMGIKRQEIIEKEAERERLKEEQRKAEEEKKRNDDEMAQRKAFQEALEAARAEGKAEAEEKLKAPRATEKERGERWGSGKARIVNISLLDNTGKKKNAFKTGDDLTVHVDYIVNETIKNAVFGIGVFRVDEVHVYGTNTRIDHVEPFDLTKDGSFDIEIKDIPLIPGEYTIDLALEEGAGIAIDYYTKAMKIQIYSDFSDVGVCRISHKWSIL